MILYVLLEEVAQTSQLAHEVLVRRREGQEAVEVGYRERGLFGHGLGGWSGC